MRQGIERRFQQLVCFRTAADVAAGVNQLTIPAQQKPYRLVALTHDGLGAGAGDPMRSVLQLRIPQGGGLFLNLGVWRTGQAGVSADAVFCFSTAGVEYLDPTLLGDPDYAFGEIPVDCIVEPGASLLITITGTANAAVISKATLTIKWLGSLDPDN